MSYLRNRLNYIYYYDKYNCGFAFYFEIPTSVGTSFKNIFTQIFCNKSYCISCLRMITKSSGGKTIARFYSAQRHLSSPYANLLFVLGDEYLDSMIFAYLIHKVCIYTGIKQKTISTLQSLI